MNNEIGGDVYIIILILGLLYWNRVRWELELWVEPLNHLTDERGV